MPPPALMCASFGREKTPGVLSSSQRGGCVSHGANQIVTEGRGGGRDMWVYVLALVDS